MMHVKSSLYMFQVEYESLIFKLVNNNTIKTKERVSHRLRISSGIFGLTNFNEM